MKLLETVRIGDRVLANRMAMAPMTRSRANGEGEVGPSVVTYYTQRSTAGLIITEGINISAQGKGSPLTPGLYTPGQIEAWKSVTRAVHEKGGTIYAQLWHTGRVGHSLVKDGEVPVAPSAIPITGQQHFTMQGPKDYETPRELQTSEIRDIVRDYGRAAANAMDAGFDGVELHAAFGYLPNQFLAESSNTRTDEYGGSTVNRNRFVIEVMESLVEAVGTGKAAIRISPTSTYNNIAHDDPTEQFSLLLHDLDTMPLAYVHIMNVPFSSEKHPNYPADALSTFVAMTSHPVIANCGYTRDSGEEELRRGRVAMISYGSLFLANPDLPYRFSVDAPLNAPDRATMYGGGDKGYIDYPFHQQEEAI